MDDRNPTSDRLRRLASRYEAGVGRGRAEQIAVRAITRAHRRTSTGRRLAVAVSSSAFVLVAMTGVGVAADRAVPGDMLYPLDRALEALGLSSDLVEERLLEAISLTERGDMALAVATANEALAELGRSGVSATLPVVASEPTDLTADTVDEPSTTTTEEELVIADAEPVDEAEVDSPADVPVLAAAEPADAVEALRLAAEQLLQSVRSAKTDPAANEQVTSAALFLAEATADATGSETLLSSTTSSSSTSTSTSSTTSTTTPQEDPRPGRGNGSDNGTTTTTVASDPDDGSGSDSSGDGEDGSPGPIFLPAP